MVSSSPYTRDFPKVGLYTALHLTSWHCSLLNSPAQPDSSELLCTYLVYRPLLSVYYLLKISWWCTLSHQTDREEVNSTEPSTNPFKVSPALHATYHNPFSQFSVYLFSYTPVCHWFLREAIITGSAKIHTKGKENDVSYLPSPTERHFFTEGYQVG